MNRSTIAFVLSLIAAVPVLRAVCSAEADAGPRPDAEDRLAQAMIPVLRSRSLWVVGKRKLDRLGYEEGQGYLVGWVDIQKAKVSVEVPLICDTPDGGGSCDYNPLITFHLDGGSLDDMFTPRIVIKRSSLNAHGFTIALYGRHESLGIDGEYVLVDNAAFQTGLSAGLSEEESLDRARVSEKTIVDGFQRAFMGLEEERKAGRHERLDGQMESMRRGLETGGSR